VHVFAWVRCARVGVRAFLTQVKLEEWGFIGGPASDDEWSLEDRVLRFAHNVSFAAAQEVNAVVKDRLSSPNPWDGAAFSAVESALADMGWANATGTRRQLFGLEADVSAAPVAFFSSVGNEEEDEEEEEEGVEEGVEMKGLAEMKGGERTEAKGLGGGYFRQRRLLDTPTPEPTQVPTPRPFAQPTSEPSPEPSQEPSGRPTARPVFPPTALPSPAPAPLPTGSPTVPPTSAPSPVPTVEPSRPTEVKFLVTFLTTHAHTRAQRERERERITGILFPLEVLCSFLLFP